MKMLLGHFHQFTISWVNCELIKTLLNHSMNDSIVIIRSTENKRVCLIPTYNELYLQKLKTDLCTDESINWLQELI